MPGRADPRPLTTEEAVASVKRELPDLLNRLVAGATFGTLDVDAAALGEGEFTTTLRAKIGLCLELKMQVWLPKGDEDQELGR